MSTGHWLRQDCCTHTHTPSNSSIPVGSLSNNQWQVSRTCATCRPRLLLLAAWLQHTQWCWPPQLTGVRQHTQPHTIHCSSNSKQTMACVTVISTDTPRLDKGDNVIMGKCVAMEMSWPHMACGTPELTEGRDHAEHIFYGIECCSCKIISTFKCIKHTWAIPQLFALHCSVFLW